ncbi:hypothetical protein J4G07_12935 [Candidatus Poribacteria bacterium]|nr:hypothetical protein [Candidatus Poribacteria bacterium]
MSKFAATHPKVKLKTEFPDVYSSRRSRDQNHRDGVPPQTCEAHLASPDELSAYIDKELPTWKRHLIRRHLKKCNTCAYQVQRLQQMDDFLHRGGEIEVPDDFLSSVMVRVSDATKHQRHHDSLWSYFTRFIRTPLGWVRCSSTLTHRLRYSIRTRSPVYIFILTFAVFTMVGATLYQSSSDRFGQSMHTLEQFQQLDGEKLISFEVIQHEPPKPLLTTYLRQPSAISGRQSAR